MNKRRVFFAVVTAVVMAAGARAGSVIVSEGVLEVRCADQGKARLPAAASLTHWITNRTFAGSARNVVGLVYESTDSTGGTGGSISGSLRLETPDGALRSLGSIDFDVDANATSAAGLIEIDEPLARGTALIWDIEFRRFRPLAQETCVQLLSVVERTDGEQRP